MELQDLLIDGKTISQKKLEQLYDKGITDIPALLSFLPKAYSDRTEVTGILGPDKVSNIIVFINEVPVPDVSYKSGKSVQYFNAIGIEKNSGSKIKITWFNQVWHYGEIAATCKQNVFVSGKVTYDEKYGTYKMTNPKCFSPYIDEVMEVRPEYRRIPGMSSAYFAKVMAAALDSPDAGEDIIPEDILAASGQPDMETAYRYIHAPENMKEAEVGQERVLYNDLLYFALKNERNNRNMSLGSQYNIKTLALYNKVLETLPFSLTPDQKQALDTIADCGKQGRRISALLQADVGAGKTLVAQLAAAMFVGSGYQVAIMAPTQVLAEQHFNDTQKLFAPFGVTVAYAGGKMKAAEKRELYKGIASGETQIVIGTTSILNSEIVFRKLALCITDEEQRFGVSQREALRRKAAEGVHTITMSATPIPRSLAMVMYGETVQLLTIKTMPEGRKPVMTGVAKSKEHIYKFIRSQVNKGHQVYVVCPLIEANEKLEGVRSVEETEVDYLNALENYGIRIATLTGKDKKSTIEETISDFRAGEIDVLIATTVIEVGVNVPNATCIIISNAERFGLSSLHQLRGRVGRGSIQSYCVLDTEQRDNDRIVAMCSTADGFEIAKADLKIRGPGDFIGTQQHGKDNKYLSLMLAYEDKYKEAVRIADELLDRGMDCCELTRRIESEEIFGQ